MKIWTDELLSFLFFQMRSSAGSWVPWFHSVHLSNSSTWTGWNWDVCHCSRAPLLPGSSTTGATAFTISPWVKSRPSPPVKLMWRHWLYPDFQSTMHLYTLNASYYYTHYISTLRMWLILFRLGHQTYNKVNTRMGMGRLMGWKSATFWKVKRKFLFS